LFSFSCHVAFFLAMFWPKTISRKWDKKLVWEGSIFLKVSSLFPLGRHTFRCVFLCKVGCSAMNAQLLTRLCRKNWPVSSSWFSISLHEKGSGLRAVVFNHSIETSRLLTHPQRDNCVFQSKFYGCFLILELTSASFWRWLSFFISLSRFIASLRESSSSKYASFCGLCTRVYLAPLPFRWSLVLSSKSLV